MKIKLIIIVGIIALGAVFLLTIKQSGNGANMTSKEQRAQQLAKQAKHLNGKQLLGFLSTYAEDEEEMEMALAILQGKDIPTQSKQTSNKPEKKGKNTQITNEQIYEVVSAPGVKAVNTLLQTVDVNATDEQGWTLLHMAVNHQRVDIVELLLKKGANVNAALTVEDDERRGWTPLDEALYDTIFRPLYYVTSPEEWEEFLNEAAKEPEMKSYVNMLRLLIKHGAKSGFVPNSDGRTVRPKDLTEQEWIERRQKKKQEETFPPTTSKTNASAIDHSADMQALVKLCKNCPPEITQRILASKDINDPIYEDGGTVLHAASYMGLTEFIQPLLAAGANVNQADFQGRMPLQHASYKGHTEIVKMLVAAGAYIEYFGDGWSALMNASDEGHLDTVKALLAAGANVNAQDPNRHWTSLMCASQNGHNEVVKTLLAAGAKVDARDSGGGTALMDACYNGHLDTVKLLIAAGADINATSNQGQSVLHFAQEGGHADVINFLIAHGATTGEKFNKQSTAQVVQSATQTGAREIIKQPREDFHTASPNRTENKELQEKFVHLCRWGKLSEIEQAVAAGADVNASDAFGNLPLEQAILSDKTQHVELLLQHGATVTPSVLKLAENHHNEEIINLLKSAGSKE